MIKDFGERPISNELIKDLKEAEFDAAIAEGVTIVDFWASWCCPSYTLAAILEDVAHTVGGRAKIVKVNIEDAPHLAERFDVQAIPTLVVFKDGDVIERFVGIQYKEPLLNLIDAIEGD